MICSTGIISTRRDNSCQGFGSSWGRSIAIRSGENWWTVDRVHASVGESIVLLQYGASPYW